MEELFDIFSSKKIYHANQIDNIYDTKEKGTFPYIVRTTKNNGVRGYIIGDKNFTNDANTLSFAQDTFTVFYQKQKYFTGNKVKILKAKFENKTERIMQYLTASFQKALNTFTWGRGSTIETISETLIQLPTKNGEIDFDFMDTFIAELEAQRIAELEAQRIAELEAYLLTSGLKDYTLTKEEEEVLKEFGSKEFEESYVINIFDVKNTKSILSRDIVKNSGQTPYLCASSENNAISSYISYNEDYLDKGNCIFIGGKTFVVTYQEGDFYSNDSHNLALYLKDKEVKSRLNQLYLATCINKSLGHKYSWGNSISNRKIQNDKVSLPSKGNELDYKKMETFISAIQKLVIKDVVLYADKKIEATKNIVKSKK